MLNVPVCVEMKAQKPYRKKQIDCEAGCKRETVEGIRLDRLDEIIATNESYCFSYYCNEMDATWKISMEICSCSNDAVDSNTKKSVTNNVR